MSTFVTFLLDETGSMMPIKDDTIGGFNQYLSKLQQDPDTDYDFTLIKFNSNRHEVVTRGVNIHEVKPLDSESYHPDAMTPLIDASVKAIKATAEKVSEGQPVIVVIQTDGYENASREFTNQDLADLVKEKTAQGWLIVFLGAGIDAFAQAGQFGISQQHTMSYDRDRSAETFAATARASICYAASGGGAAGLHQATFTNEERDSAAGTTSPTARPIALKSLVDDMDI